MMGVCGNVATDDFFKHKNAWVLGDVIGLNTIILDLDFWGFWTFNQFGPSVLTGLNCLNPCKLGRVNFQKIFMHLAQKRVFGPKMPPKSGGALRPIFPLRNLGYCINPNFNQCSNNSPNFGGGKLGVVLPRFLGAFFGPKTRFWARCINFFWKFTRPRDDL